MQYSIPRQHLKIAAASIAAFIASHAASAHEFWLQPESFWVHPAATVSLTLQVGDESSRQRSQIRFRRVTRFASISPAGEVLDRRDPCISDRACGALAMPNSGEWLVAVAWTEVLPESDSVDFETTFSTLTFGFPAAHGKQ